MTPFQIPPALLEKYLRNQCTEPEIELIEAWYASLNGQPDFLNKLTEEEQLYIRKETFLNIQNQIYKNETPKSASFPWQWLAGIAATIVLAVGFYLVNRPSEPLQISITQELAQKMPESITRFTNKQSRIILHQLPDGSTVWMRKDARITYPNQFDADKRVVAFEGEGFFDIRKDSSRPFSIQSGEMVIKVLGTSFNVKAPVTKKVFQISVVTGSVEVSAPDQQKNDQLVVLKPQQEVFFETKSKRLIVGAIPVQLKKEIYQPVTVTFKDTPLTEVLDQLKKKFNIDIQLSNPEMATCQVNADFERQSLPLIMEMLCTTLDASYSMSDNMITMSGMSCE
jgi:transmembrane sensor